MFGIAVTGLLLGPALNLLIDRLPFHQSLFARPSCPSCGTARPWYSLLPFSRWWFARDICTGCEHVRRRRMLVVNVGLPLAGAALWSRDGSGLTTYIYLFLAAYFLAIAAIDLEHRVVLNRMTLAGLVAAFMIAALGRGPSIRGALIGMGIGFLFLLIPNLLMPGLGMGDVKLAAVIGALVGYPAVFTALTVGVLAGGIAAGVLLLSRRIDRRGTIAYAPYLVIGVALVLFGVMG